jgi:transcriptional regulator with XRE-family HTH domain
MKTTVEGARIRAQNRLVNREAGRTVRRAREELGASQKELAEAAELEQSVVSKIESGTRSILRDDSLTVLQRALDALERQAGYRLEPPFHIRISANIGRVAEDTATLTADELKALETEYSRPAYTRGLPAVWYPRRATAGWRRLLEQAKTRTIYGHEVASGPGAGDPFRIAGKEPIPEAELPAWVHDADAALREGQLQRDTSRDATSHETHSAPPADVLATGPVAAAIAASRGLADQLISQAAAADDASMRRLVTLQRLMVSLAALDDDGMAKVARFASGLAE